LQEGQLFESMVKMNFHQSEHPEDFYVFNIEGVSIKISQWGIEKEQKSDENSYRARRGNTAIVSLGLEDILD